LLPLYVLSLLKHAAIRGGTDVNLDERVCARALLAGAYVKETIGLIHPRLFAVHNLEREPGIGMPAEVEIGEDGEEKVADEDGSVAGRERIRLPSTLALTVDSLSSDGIYVLDNGVETYVWVGRASDPAATLALFGMENLEHANMQMIQLNTQGNDLATTVSTIISALHEDYDLQAVPPLTPKITIVREGEPHMEPRFFWNLVEDRAQFNGGTYTYPEFMQFVNHASPGGMPPGGGGMPPGPGGMPPGTPGGMQQGYAPPPPPGAQPPGYMPPGAQSMPPNQVGYAHPPSNMPGGPPQGGMPPPPGDTGMPPPPNPGGMAPPPPHMNRDANLPGPPSGYGNQPPPPQPPNGQFQRGGPPAPPGGGYGAPPPPMGASPSGPPAPPSGGYAPGPPGPPSGGFAPPLGPPAMGVPPGPPGPPSGAYAAGPPGPPSVGYAAGPPGPPSGGYAAGPPCPPSGGYGQQQPGPPGPPSGGYGQQQPGPPGPPSGGYGQQQMGGAPPPPQGMGQMPPPPGQYYQK